MANALISWLQLSALAPAGQAQVSWLQLSAAASAGQAQVSWLQLQAISAMSLACDPGAFAIAVAPSIALYAMTAAVGAVALSGQSARLTKSGRGSALLGQIESVVASTSRHVRPAQLAVDIRPAQ